MLLIACRGQTPIAKVADGWNPGQCEKHPGREKPAYFGAAGYSPSIFMHCYRFVMVGERCIRPGVF
jgi:hypothetical protein